MQTVRQKSIHPQYRITFEAPYLRATPIGEPNVFSKVSDLSKKIVKQTLYRLLDNKKIS